MSAHSEPKIRVAAEVDGGYTSVCLCPICLRKLEFAVGFDIIHRYKLLEAFYETNGWNSQAAWVCRAIAALS